MNLRDAFRTGASFGLTSGVLTTLGLIVGLHSGTHSRAAIIGGVMTIAVADALSDALGIHVHEESENEHSPREIWVSTLATLVTKFAMAASFLLPLMTLQLSYAIVASIAWGAVVLTLISFFLARDQHIRSAKVISEHLGIAALVVVLTHLLGDWTARLLS
ncbi:MAG: hypothetical protein O6758_04960 [Planctomycetota bacterium]|nr:hypothetical protein [Planctomycetota bacterium]